jgi:hypothetical protein
MYYTSSVTGDQAYSAIQDALNRNFVVGCDTSGSSLYGLATSHAYAILGTYEIKSSTGASVAKLIRVRNPWNIDTYSGPWCDSCSDWTDAYKA